MIALKDNNYALSLVLYKSRFLGNNNQAFVTTIFNFNSNDMNGYKEIQKVDNGMYDFVNSTSCLQTENELIICTFIELTKNTRLSIVIFDFIHVNYVLFFSKLLSMILILMVLQK